MNGGSIFRITNLVFFFLQDMAVPWKSIFLSLPVWAIIVAHFSTNWGFYTLLTELPNYLKNRLDFDLTQVIFSAPLALLAS